MKIVATSDALIWSSAPETATRAGVTLNIGDYRGSVAAQTCLEGSLSSSSDSSSSSTSSSWKLSVVLTKHSAYTQLHWSSGPVNKGKSCVVTWVLMPSMWSRASSEDHALDASIGSHCPHFAMTIATGDHALLSQKRGR